MLTFNDVSKLFGDRLILDGISFTINPETALGLSARTDRRSLAVAAGSQTADGGTVSLQPGVRLGMLRQGFTDQRAGTLLDLLLAATPRLARLLGAWSDLHLSLARLRQADPNVNPRAFHAYETAINGFEGVGGYVPVEDLSMATASLGLGDIPLTTPLSTLSGGQKTRAGLAALLTDDADLLLLDEPTNHLDIDGLAWLAHYLSTFRGAALTVSHDRAFLNAVITQTFDLDDRSGHLAF